MSAAKGEPGHATGADAFRHPSEWLTDPCVRVHFRPGVADTEMAEHFGALGLEAGPAPTWVVRRTLDRLDQPPHRVVAEPHDSGRRAAWLTLEFDGTRLALIEGLDDDQVNTALIALHLASVAPRPMLAAVTEAGVAAAEAELARRAVERDGYLARRQAPLADLAVIAAPRPDTRPASTSRKARPQRVAPVQESFL